MEYIAKKPVRFDRNYSIGETIDGDKIDAKAVKKLIDGGYIYEVKEEKPFEFSEEIKEQIKKIVLEVLQEVKKK